MRLPNRISPKPPTELLNKPGRRSIVSASDLRLLARIALVAALGTISWLALTPSPPQGADLGWDKANHTAAFFVLSVLVFCSLSHREWRGWAGLAGYGAVLEVVQWSSGHRVFELWDMAANLTGIISCILCQRFLIRLPLIKTIKADSEAL